LLVIRSQINKFRVIHKQRFLYFHCKPIPVMKTGFSLCSISNREKPVFIKWEPCNENRFFLVGKYYRGKTLFWPCTGPVRDCSVFKTTVYFGFLAIISKSGVGCFFVRNSLKVLQETRSYICFSEKFI
jgi:hypothetical protein